MDDLTLEPTPTWTYLTDDDNLVASFTIDRGRTFELEQTDEGRADVKINDVAGLLDPTNSGSVFYGRFDTTLQVQLELFNPVTAAYHVVFRGFIDELDYVPKVTYRDGGGNVKGVNQLQMSCMDLFGLLKAIEMQPDGSFGDTPPSGSEGNIYFDNLGFPNVDDRMIQVLGNAGIPTDFYTIFSGNVSLQGSVYSPKSTVLDVLQDAANAEFPVVANVYASRDGKVTFHGRLARFDPAGTAAGATPGAWNYTNWKAGDEQAVRASLSDTGQIREFAYNRGRAQVRNYAYAAPQGIALADKGGQTVTDPTSIGNLGYMTWIKEELQVNHGLLTGNTANDECKLFAQYIVNNYAEPRDRITRIVFKSMRPDDDRATANWALLCGAEIADTMDVTVGHPGGGGFNAEPTFVEGVHYNVRPLNGDYAMIEMSLDLSPRALFDDPAGLDG